MKKQIETVVIDGYNVIHRWQYFRRLASESLDNLRQRLLTMMENWSALEDKRVILVFDGDREDMSTRTTGNVKVLFSPRGFTADTVIEQYMTRRQKKTLVVTSDRACASICAMRGCPVTASEVFEQEILTRLETVWQDSSAQDPGNAISDRIRKGALLTLLETLKDDRERHRREKLLAEMSKLREERHERRELDRKETEELRKGREAERNRREEEEALRQFHALYGTHKTKKKKQEDARPSQVVIVEEDFDWTQALDDSFKDFDPKSK